MALVKDIAIVLRRLDYSETSQVLAVFTREHGLQRLIAKGIKRGSRDRFAVGIDLLELGRVVFSLRPGKEGNLATLTEWRQDDGFPHLRADLAKCYAAQYAAEVTTHLTELHDPHSALFDELRAFLQRLKSDAALQSLVEFLWRLLKEIGLLPELNACVNCGRAVQGQSPVYFSSRQGGVVCRDCEPAMIEKRRVDGGLLAGFSDSRAFHSGDAAAAFELLDYHLREIIGRPPVLSSLLRAAVGLSRRK